MKRWLLAAARGRAGKTGGMRDSLPGRDPILWGLASFVLIMLLPAAGGGQELPCTDCHDLDIPAFEASVHGSAFTCTDCHTGADNPDEHPEGMTPATCADCHEDAVSELAESIHGRLWEEGAESPSSCMACHGDIHTFQGRDEVTSPIHPDRLAATCGSCHANPEMAERFRLRRIQPVEAYLASVHAQAVANGDEAATCSSCHGSHAIFPAADPRSTVNHANVPTTCGHCHGDIAETYRTSIHGQALAAGIREAPACTDCHGEHRIQSPTEEDGGLYATSSPKMACEHCHGDLRLAEKYGLDADKVPAYEDSYHGLAARAGILTVAHCDSCHGVHDILPSTDPRSSIYPANLPATCGQCHPGAGKSFAIGTVHVVTGSMEHPVIYWVRLLYLWIIALTIGAMLVHNGLDFQRKVRTPRRLWFAPLPLGAPASRERLLPGFRLAHGLMAVSFIVLAVSGFALKYPEAFWARPLIGWESTIALRGWVHRVAALVMIASTVVHAVHLILNRKARSCIAEMRPTLHDWKELKGRLAWYFGRRPYPPRTPWVGYPEKMEYLALIWGTVVMALTGFLLWFENLALRWLPKWWTDVATVIHFYEAILATAAIFVWHFYFVIFDPAVYPMDRAWLHGRSTRARDRERGYRPPAVEFPTEIAAEPEDSAPSTS